MCDTTHIYIHMCDMTHKRDIHIHLCDLPRPHAAKILTFANPRETDYVHELNFIFRNNTREINAKKRKYSLTMCTHLTFWGCYD